MSSLDTPNECHQESLHCCFVPTPLSKISLPRALSHVFNMSAVVAEFCKQGRQANYQNQKLLQIQRHTVLHIESIVSIQAKFSLSSL